MRKILAFVPAFASVAASGLLASLPAFAMSAAAGHTCEPDIARFCLGTQGVGRAVTVQCLRDHLEQLTPDCRDAMGPENQKNPAASSEQK